MPKITNISKQKNNKDRYNLFIDEQFYAGVSLEIVLLNRLKIGDEIDQERLKTVIFESDKASALNKALGYISRSIKTKREIKNYLIKKGYSEEIVWYCIDKLKEYDYVNDVEYSQKYIEATNNTQGKNLSKFKLMAKGVKKEDIEKALECSNVDYVENAKNLAVKYLKNKEKTKENLLKAYKYLIGRGFSYEEADSAILYIKSSIEEWSEF